MSVLYFPAASHTLRITFCPFSQLLQIPPLPVSHQLPAKFTVIIHGRHPAFFFKYPEKMVVTAETAQLTDILYRHSLQQIFFAQINTGPGNISVQRHSRMLFKFPGNMLSGYEKSFFQRI